MKNREIKNYENKEQAIEALMGEHVIIESLLDNDLYKFTMQQYAFHNNPDDVVKYRFKCRTDKNILHLKEIIEHQIKKYCELSFKKEELEYLSQMEGFESDYIEFLSGLNHSFSDVSIFEEDEDLMIEIEGLWTHTILMEVPFLAIVNGVETILEATENGGVKCYVENGLKKLDEKIKEIKENNLRGNQIKLVEFGVRRRFYGFNYQFLLNERLNDEIPGNYLGASNVLLGKELGVKVYGTMAHEYLQAAQAISSPEESQDFAFKSWLKEYKGKLAVALSDIYGNEAFFADFSKELASVYDGLRHDSGDPFRWGDMVLSFYRKNGINPKEKTVMFSDGLNVGKALELNDAFRRDINVVFGIGTNITNDTGIKPLSIVIKMVSFNNKPVAKVSNDMGKTMCKDENYMSKLKEIIKNKKKKYEELYG
tara:strand:+ start:724 stop:1998 length:1275 start_codon:yes stop_codon:yes gene_type:complete